MYYKIIDNGKSRNLLILHCICGNTNIFKEQYELLSKLYNLILIDFPAHGNSLNYENNFSFESITEEILDILQNNNIKKVDILSISMGAMIADVLVTKAPSGLIGKVVFTSSVIGFPISIMNYMFSVFAKLFNILPIKLCMHFITYMMLPCKINKTQRARLYKYSLIMNRKSLHKYLIEMSNFMFSKQKYDYNKLSGLCDDYIFINGSLDFLFLPQISKSVPKPHLLVLSKASHLCNFDKKVEYNTALMNFLI